MAAVKFSHEVVASLEGMRVRVDDGYTCHLETYDFNENIWKPLRLRTVPCHGPKPRTGWTDGTR
jgi:hypothetical protein